MTPAVYQTVLLSFGGDARGVVAKGVDPERERRSDEALQRIVAGRLDFSPDADGIEALLIGKQLAQEWKISPGDYVTLTSPQGRLTPFGMMPRTRRFRVAGVFDSGFYDYDENWCFMTLAAAQALSGTGDIVNVLEFRLNQPEAAAEIARHLEARGRRGVWPPPPGWKRIARCSGRFASRSWSPPSSSDLITFVAGLNVLVVLSMTVTDKARDIAVLMSMGARREQIRRIFLVAGNRDRRDRHAYRLMRRIRICVDRRHLSPDSAGPAGLRRALRAVSPQRVGRRLDHPRGDGDLRWGDHAAGASRVATIARRDSSL